MALQSGSEGSVWQAKFLDLDDAEVCREAETKAAGFDCTNFVAIFGPDTAKLAYDLQESDVTDLLAARTPSEHVRWVNLWKPSDQPLVVRAIGDRYGFSPRLQALMRTPRPHTSRQIGRIKVDVPEKQRDVEDPVSTCTRGFTGHGFRTQDDDDLALYDLVKNTFNFTSIDHGESFMCIAANWLHRRPRRWGSRIDGSSLIPPKHWCWLALCADHTIVSVHEVPSFERPPPGENVEQWEAAELQNMRFNTLSVLMQLSRSCPDRYKNAILSRKPVRDSMMRDEQAGSKTWRSGASNPDEASVHVSREGASGLFYYLFEDYAAGAPILKQSRRILDQLSDMIFHQTRWKSKATSKDSDIIPQLHGLSKELRQLQHLYESYKGLIQRILTPPTHMQDAPSLPATADSLSRFDATLSLSARRRFERLADRLQLLMLNTISEYQEEKSALADTYFNLTAQKDSQATARLTRSATLLAKMSVFFLPITFMTSYFSVEIPGFLESYTNKTYWISFAIIAGLSFISLFFFSRMLMFVSEMLEDWATAASKWLRRWIQRLWRRRD